MNIDKYDIRDAMRYTWIEPLFNNENCKAWSEAALQEKIYREILTQAYKEAIDALKHICIEIDKVGLIFPDWAQEVLDKYPQDD